MFIDVAISRERNVTRKEAEKILKYKSLIIKTERMWNVKTNVVPVITRATGTTSKSFRKYLSNITGKHEIDKLQKTTVLSKAHKFPKVLMLKYKRFNMGNSITCDMNSNYTIAVTPYTLETWVISGI
jgi:hypothetical protein